MAAEQAPDDAAVVRVVVGDEHPWAAGRFHRAHRTGRIGAGHPPYGDAGGVWPAHRGPHPDATRSWSGDRLARDQPSVRGASDDRDLQCRHGARRRPARRRRAPPDRRVLARGELPVGRPDLPARQPAAPRAARRGARQAAPARPLGHDARPELHLRPPEPRDPGARPRRDLRDRARATAVPRIVANAWLEGTYSEVYPSISRDGEGMRRLFRQFSFPGGIPSHVAPETPGSIHEGGELGYSLSHAFGAAFDNPDLLVCCVVGDGEAETGPLATSWHSNKFLNPARDGAVLPILHLNGYKIANPTVLARIPDDELDALMEGYGYHAVLRRGRRSGRRPPAAGRDARRGRRPRSPRSSRRPARTASPSDPRWPMIVLRTPKGWTGPKVVDGHQVEGTWRAHQVPMAEVRTNAGPPRSCSSRGCGATAPRSCSTSDGSLRPELAALAPDRRRGA